MSGIAVEDAISNNGKELGRAGCPDAERFWSLCTPEPNSGCWLWEGTTNRGGYGGYNQGGRRLSAHRVAYALARGLVPSGAVVMHRCDNPACVNPDHLELGRQRDNVMDMVRKGRAHAVFPCGMRHPRAKLTAQQVHEIRERRERGATVTRLAREYGIATSYVSKLALGRARSES